MVAFGVVLQDTYNLENEFAPEAKRGLILRFIRAYVWLKHASHKKNIRLTWMFLASIVPAAVSDLDMCGQTDVGMVLPHLSCVE